MVSDSVKVADSVKDLPEPFAFPEFRQLLCLRRTQDEDQTKPFAWQSDTSERGAFEVDWRVLRKLRIDLLRHLEEKRKRPLHRVQALRFLAVDRAWD